MMDSQENSLVTSPVEETGTQVEVNAEETAPQAPAAPEVETATAAEAPAAEAPAAEAPAEPTAAGGLAADTPEAPAPQEEQQERRQYASKQEVLDRVKEIAHGEEAPQKDEVDYLKTAFYKLHIAEREAKLREYIDGGGDPETYQITPDEAEEAFKAEMGIIKERRQQLFREQEAEKEENLKKKLAIIEKIKAMVTSPEEASKTYQDCKALQQEWRDIKAVPAERANELWRNYQLYVEQFYDLLKLNIEARELDFKKNLEAKTRLCEAAEKLADEPDVISAFHQLQKLHQEYREIGPVSKDLREEVWNRFKAASTVINKRHQQHFEGLRAREEENLEKKTALCEKVEAIAAEENKGNADWDRHTQEIIALQQEWKTIGMVPKKLGDQLWEEFLGACNKFFEARNAAGAGQRGEERQNLEKKRDVISRLKAVAEEGQQAEGADVQTQVQQLVEEYNNIGHVPFKEKDKLYDEYHAVLDKLYKELNVSVARRRLSKFKDTLKQVAERGEGALDNERQRLMRQLDQIKQEVQTYENNLGFLSASSKKGNSLIDEMNRKMQKLKDDMQLVKDKIKAIDQENAEKE